MNGSEPKRLPAWPWLFLGGCAVLSGSFFVINWWPRDYPHQSALTQVSGKIDTVVVRDDISDTTAGAILPGMTSVHFTLEGVDGVFRYPSTHPRYYDVRDRTAVEVELWVDPAELGAGEPVTIWQIREHNPHDEPEEETFVAYADVVERLSSGGEAFVRLGSSFLLGGAMLLLVGFAIRRHNRRAAV